MAAIARDDEAEIHECCECLLLALMSKQVLLQATFSKMLYIGLILQQIAERRGTC